MIGARYIFVLFFATDLLQYVNCEFDYEKIKAEGKIVGGNYTTIQEHPEQAYLLIKSYGKYFACGGSILNKRTVLTAAHCLVDAETVYVKVGITDLNEMADYQRAKYTLSHPDYNKIRYDFDVAIVRLKYSITLDGKKVKAIRLVDGGSDVPAGSEITLTGWGTTSEGGSTSNTLKVVKLTIYSNSKCKEIYPYLTDRMICAGTKNGGNDICQGDAGGPAVFSNSGLQVGIVSFGQGCGRPDVPGLYSNIANVELRKWIEDNSEIK